MVELNNLTKKKLKASSTSQDSHPNSLPNSKPQQDHTKKNITNSSIKPFNLAGSISAYDHLSRLTNEQWHAHARLAAEKMAEVSSYEDFGLVEEYDDDDGLEDILSDDRPSSSNNTDNYVPQHAELHPYDRFGALYNDTDAQLEESDLSEEELSELNSKSPYINLQNLKEDTGSNYYAKNVEQYRAYLNASKKELFENVRHGTTVFPFASYVWSPQNYPSRVTLHWHREMELVRFEKGLFHISIDMQDTFIQDHAFLLLPSNAMHTFTLPSNCVESAIVFDPKMLMLQNYDEVQSEVFDPLISGNIPLPPLITPAHPAFAKIDTLYRYCARHGATTNASRRLIIKSKLLEILSIYHEYGLISRKDVHANVKRSKQDKLKELLNYIDSHYAGPMSVKDASQRLGVTDQYFCRFFKRVTGMSFTEYLNDLRLRRAAKEIELTTRSISEIAYEHGFENAGYFFKSFKQKFGITPLRYRKRHHLEFMAQMALQKEQQQQKGEQNTNVLAQIKPSVGLDHQPYTKIVITDLDQDKGSTRNLLSTTFKDLDLSSESDEDISATSVSYEPLFDSDVDDEFDEIIDKNNKEGLVEFKNLNFDDEFDEDMELSTEENERILDEFYEEIKPYSSLEELAHEKKPSKEKKKKVSKSEPKEEIKSENKGESKNKNADIEDVHKTKDRTAKLSNMPPLNMDSMHKISPQAALRARIEELERLSKENDPFDL